MSRPKLPEEVNAIIEELYRPDYDPENFKLANMLKLDKDDLKIVEQRVKETENRIFGARDGSTVPTPLTAEEAAAVEQKVDQMRNAIAATRNRIHLMRSKIDSKAVPEGQPEVSFEMDLKKKQRLRRAIKKVFGSSSVRAGSTLTYSMYRAALDAKRKIEDQEAENYTSGNWED
jgi:hypothetical protein